LLVNYLLDIFSNCPAALSPPATLHTTFGGMWRCRRVAVARVFALVVRCRVLRLLLYSRVGKNRDTRRESPGGAGGGPYNRPQNDPL